MRFSVLMTVAAALLVGGCASDKFVGRPDLKVVSGTALPAPAESDLIGEPRPYLIGPLDHVAIDIFGVPDLSRTVQVDANGRIAMPLIGSIEAAGKTPAQLADLIQTRLQETYLRDPRVSVNLTETVSQVLTVDGEVEEPGLYVVSGRMTLMRAIAKAKGVTQFALQNHVVIFRRVNNQNMAALYDLRGIRLGMYPDPEVYANDIVLVGESNSRHVFKDLLSASGILAAPLVALLQ